MFLNKKDRDLTHAQTPSHNKKKEKTDFLTFLTKTRWMADTFRECIGRNGETIKQRK